MDSRSRRLPFCLSSPRSSYSSGASVTSSSSSLGSSRLYSRDPVLSSDRFPRATSAFKADRDAQSSHLLSSSRDYSSSDSRSSSWKLPSVTSTTRSYDRPWADSPLSSRSKLTDSDARFGMRSGLLTASDDGDSKRAKMTYNRGLYSRTSSTPLTGSTYSGSTLSSCGGGSSRGAGEKQSDPYDSSWSSCRFLSRSSSSSSSSKPLSTRRELEKASEPGLCGLGERRIRSPGLTSSLYHTDRVTSTYAQGARPKETTYTSSISSSSTSRESPLTRHLSSSSSSSLRSSPLVRDPVIRSASSYSPRLHSTQEQTRTPQHVPSHSSSSSSSSQTHWYTRAEEAPPPRQAPESAEPEGRRSTRRLLSRLFSRRSSQDSSSGSSSVRSLEDDARSTGSESVESDEGARAAAASLEGDSSGPQTTPSGLRVRRADLAPIQEGNVDGYRSSAHATTATLREPSGSGSGSSSWLSSSFRGRCPPLLARLRRHAREENVHTAAGLEDPYSRPQRLLRRWDDLERKTSQEDDDEDTEEEEEEEDDDEEDEEDEEVEGAVGVDVFGATSPLRAEVDKLPELEDASSEFSPRRRLATFESLLASTGQGGGAESQTDGQRDKPASSRDQEKLRKIKERLLLEDSDEEEGDLCRICQMGEESASNPLIQPCRCTGSLQYVHQDCIKRWLCSKIGSGTNLEAITTCELCKEKLRLNIDNFDIQELYRTHVQSEYDDFISSGLYLVVLLHFCEQRFSDVLGAVDAAGLFNLVRILHEHMDNLEIPHDESDREVRDGRPSIEFSDLDDDLEEEY